MQKLMLILLFTVMVCGCASTRHQILFEGDPSQTAQIVSFETVMIKYIDNENMGVSFIGQSQLYDIKAGQHTILVEYSDLFDVDSDSHDRVVSRPAKITFVAEAGKRYQIQNPLQKRLNHAKAFAEKPEFWVVQLPSGERVSSKMELSRPRSFMAGLALENKPDYEFASDAVDTASNAAPALAVIPAASAVAASSPAPKPAGEELSNLKLLQYSWKNATQSEREAFIQWVNENANSPK